MRLVEKNVSWASFLSCISLKQGLISKCLSAWSEEEASCTGAASTKHAKQRASVAANSHTPLTVENNLYCNSGSIRAPTKIF